MEDGGIEANGMKSITQQIKRSSERKGEAFTRPSKYHHKLFRPKKSEARHRGRTAEDARW